MSLSLSSSISIQVFFPSLEVYKEKLHLDWKREEKIWHNRIEKTKRDQWMGFEH